MTYRHFIDRAHPVVEELFGSAPADRAHVLAHGLERLARRSIYVPGPPGRRAFDDLRSALTHADRLPINCLNWSCLLVSYLRACGLHPDDVFSAVVTARGTRLACNVVHAGVLVRDAAQGWLWIDPARPGPARQSAGDLASRYAFAVIFNDREVFFQDADKRRLLSGARRRGVRLYVYGRADASLRALIRTPAFTRIVPDLCAGRAIDGDATDQATAEAATRVELLARAGAHYEAGRRLLPVSAAAEATVRDMVEPALDRYAAIVASGIGALRRAYAGTAAARRFEWDQVAHTVVAGMLMDVAVGRHLHLPDEVIERHGDAVVWAFEHVSADNAYGVVWTADPARAGGFGQLWHCTVDRTPMRLAPHIAAVLGQAAAGEPLVGGEKALLYLSHLGLMRRAAGDRGYAAAVPVFDAGDAGRLLQAIDPLAARLVDEVMTPALALVARHPLWSRAASPRSMHPVVRLLLEYAIDRVVGGGLLAPFPVGADVPLAWGRWIWTEPVGTPPLMPRVFDAPGTAVVAG